MKGEFMVYGPDPVEEAKQATWMKKTGGYARDMTLRDHYAGLSFGINLAKFDEWKLNELTEQAYIDADAMLKAREGK
jgi:hypothetical protein